MENKIKIINYWIEGAKFDYEASLDLFKSKKYPHSLFFSHLSIEKLLKAIYVKNKDEYPPKTHNLLYFLKKNDIKVSDNYLEYFSEINSFNIETRYPDEKFDFYNKCTEKFAKKYLKIIKEIRNWLLEKYLK